MDKKPPGTVLQLIAEATQRRNEKLAQQAARKPTLTDRFIRRGGSR